MIISAAPDHITISVKDFFSHFCNLFTNQESNIYEEHDGFIRVYGYSCRTLFEMCVLYFKSINKNQLTSTGLQHTSFKNIINKYINEEDLHIFEYTNNINKIKEQEITTDLVLVTHLFGQDLDFTFLKQEKPKNNNMIIIEDRAQGGSLTKNFSEDIIDISLYSMGMDKRPNSLGGGFINIRNNEKTKPLINYLINNTLRRETKLERCYNLVKKIPTFLIYNFKLLTYVLLYIVSILKYFNSNINTGFITSYYRNLNPGFSHSNYMMVPSYPLLKSIKENINNHWNIERVQSSKNNKYMTMLSDTIKTNNYPWYRGNDLLTNYHTIYIGLENIDHFINMCKHNNICVIHNPTYKSLDEKYKVLSESLLYITCLNTLTNKEMIFLSTLIEKYA